jgi:hypothetical protein
VAQVEIETVAYPSWWSGATTVSIEAVTASYNVARSGVEFLPEGIAFTRPSDDAPVLIPWAQIKLIVSI